MPDPPSSRVFKRPPPKRYGAAGRGADTTARPKPAPKRPAVKPAAKRPAAKPRARVQVNVRPPDRADERQVRRTEQLRVSRPKTPDQADRKRSPAQQRQDARVVARNVRDSRRRVVVRGRQEGVRAVLTGKGGRTIDTSAQFSAGRAASRKQRAERLAPVLSVLEQTLRPIHGVAAGTRAGIAGKNPLPAAGRGLALKDKSLFSDVLRDLGVKGPTASIAGFALDVLLDPTTYVTGGTASVARSASLKAATRVEKKALKSGLTPEQAKRFGEYAGKRAAKRAGNARGVSVRFAGREVPGVTRATAKVGRGAARTVGRPGRAVASGVRRVGEDFSTGVRPKGIDRETYAGIRQATRTARSTSSREIYKVRQRAAAVNKSIGDTDYKTVLDAIEAGTIRSLPANLQTPAKFLRDQFKYARRVERQAGIKGAVRKNYVPHVDAKLAEAGRGVGGRAVGARQVSPSSSRARSDKRSLVEIRGTDPGKYIEDPGVIYAARMSESAMSRSKADLNRRLGSMGRPLERGKPANLGEGETAYLIRGSDIIKLEGRDLERALEQSTTRTYKQGSRDATVARAAELRERAKKIGRELEQIEHQRSRIVGAQGVRRGQDAAKAPQRAYYVGSRRFETRAEAEAFRRANGGKVRIVARTGREARRVGDVSQLDNLTAARKAAQAAALAEARKLDDELKGVRPSTVSGQLVALNEKAVDRALQGVKPNADRSNLGIVFDRGQGVWKFAATQVNPGFHLRNLVGDTQNAFLAQPAHRLGRNLVHSGRALTELGRQERALRTLETVGQRIDPGGKGVKINGKKVTYAQLILEAERTGGVRSGFVSRELHDLMEGRAVKPKTRAAAMTRWLNNREDLIRLATYIGGRQKGLDPEAAAAHTANYHFDYSDLTSLERRVMRRIMPFWTFSARNLPLQFRSLLSRPGKYAQYEKIREEISRAFGYDDDWENDLSKSEQRGAPIGIRIGGKPYTISLGPSGLPLTDLNEFPTTANPSKQADEWIQKAMSMVTPAIKTPTELWANMSFFFRDQIEKEDAPLVPISTLVVKTVPEGMRKQLGFAQIVDKRSGKKQWAAPAKLVYALGVLPGPASFLNRVTTPSERAGQDTTSKAVGYAGLRVRPIDAASTMITNLYDERGEIDKRMRALNQQGINAGYATDEYRRLQQQEKEITSHIMALRTKRGDKILPGGRTRLAQPNTGGEGVRLDPADLADIQNSIREGSRIDPSDLEEIRQQIRGR